MTEDKFFVSPVCQEDEEELPESEEGLGEEDDDWNDEEETE